MLPMDRAIHTAATSPMATPLTSGTSASATLMIATHGTGIGHIIAIATPYLRGPWTWAACRLAAEL